MTTTLFMTGSGVGLMNSYMGRNDLKTSGTGLVSPVSNRGIRRYLYLLMLCLFLAAPQTTWARVYPSQPEHNKVDVQGVARVVPSGQTSNATYGISTYNEFVKVIMSEGSYNNLNSTPKTFRVFRQNFDACEVTDTPQDGSGNFTVTSGNHLTLKSNLVVLSVKMKYAINLSSGKRYLSVNEVSKDRSNSSDTETDFVLAGTSSASKTLVIKAGTKEKEDDLPFTFTAGSSMFFVFAVPEIIANVNKTVDLTATELGEAGQTKEETFTFYGFDIFNPGEQLILKVKEGDGYRTIAAGEKINGFEIVKVEAELEGYTYNAPSGPSGTYNNIEHTTQTRVTVRYTVPEMPEECGILTSPQFVIEADHKNLARETYTGNKVTFTVKANVAENLCSTEPPVFELSSPLNLGSQVSGAATGITGYIRLLNVENGVTSVACTKSGTQASYFTIGDYDAANKRIPVTFYSTDPAPGGADFSCTIGVTAINANGSTGPKNITVNASVTPAPLAEFTVSQASALTSGGTLDFGTFTIDEGDAVDESKTFTVTNKANIKTGPAITVTGDDAFTKSGTGDNFTLRFNSGVAGVHTAAMTVTATNPDGVTTTFSQTVTAQIITVNPNDVASVTIGEEINNYETFEAALNAANNAASTPKITLLRNCTGAKAMTSGQEIKRSMTIDLNGCELASALSNAYAFKLNNANVALTVTDTKTGGAITTTASAATKSVFQLDKGWLNIVRCRLSVTSTAATVYGVKAAANTELYIDGATITATATSAAYGIHSDGTNILQNNPAITATASSTTTADALYAAANATTMIYDGTYTAVTRTGAAAAVYSLGNTGIKAGTFSATVADAAANFARAVYVEKGNTAIYSGSFNATAIQEQAHALQVAATGSAYVYGGTFTGKLSACIKDKWTTGAQILGTLEAQNATFAGDAQTAGTTEINVNAAGIYANGGSSILRLTNCTLSGTTSTYLNRAYGIYSTAKELTMTGCRIIATSGQKVAYGVYNTTALTMRNCEVIATSALTDSRGISQNGNVTSTIISSSFNATAKTTTAYGAVVSNGKLNAEGTTFTAITQLTGTTANASSPAYGFYISGGNAELTDCSVTAKTTSAYGANIYGLYNNSTKTLTVNNCTVEATSLRVNAYAIYNNNANSVTIVNSGRFKATVASGETSNYPINAIASVGKTLLYGGVYNTSNNLDKYAAPEHLVSSLASDRTEYKSPNNYRYEITPADASAAYVCQIGSTKYKTLEEALQVVNANTGTSYTICMLDNYTLPAGDYTLPAKATLLVPYKAAQTTAIGTSPITSTTSPANRAAYKKLTFSSGVNFTCAGTIEVSAQQYAGGGANTGCVQGPYGQIALNEGSHIDLEPTAKLQAWGYITGTGTINAKSGSAVYEMFVLGDWSGGAQAYAMKDNSNKVFMVSHYYYQNIESPITYRPGCKAYGYWAVNISNAVQGNSVQLVGVTGETAMFRMSKEDASSDTWVRKEYKPATDRTEYYLNSGAQLGAISMTVSISIISVTMSTADYTLPISSNMDIIMNEGIGIIGENTYMTPCSRMIINKLATCSIAKNLYLYDADDFINGTDPNYSNKTQYGKLYRIGYSPSWGTSNPRSLTPTDAEMFVHGKVKVSGQLYTTSTGSNIHSTIEDGGLITYTAAATSATVNLYQHSAGEGSGLNGKAYYAGHSCTAAQLKDEDGTYHPTANTTTAQSWVYMLYDSGDGRGEVPQWVKITNTNDCFTVLNDKYYAYPSDFVEVEANASDHAYHDAAHSEGADGCRYFIYTDASTSSSTCTWWECDAPVVVGGQTYYVANQERFENYGTYYYYDSGTSYWKPKTVTINWKNYDGSWLKMKNSLGSDVNATYTMNFNIKPRWLGTPNPSRSASNTYSYYEWTGWDTSMGNSGKAQYGLNDGDLPLLNDDVVSENAVTFYAHFDLVTKAYSINFVNSTGEALLSKLLDYGTPAAEVEALAPEAYKEATVSKVYNFSGWSPAFTDVTAAKTYTASYTEKTREYTVTFYDYNGKTILQQSDVPYGTTPSYGGAEPTRAKVGAVSYIFDGWNTALTAVAGEQSYTAQYRTAYTITFKNDDGTLIETKEVEWGETPVCSVTPTKASTAEYDFAFISWDKTITPAVKPATYTAVYGSAKRSYTIRFVNYDGTELQSSKWEYGTTPSYTEAMPSKAEDANYAYTFSGWDPDIAIVTGDATYTAQFNAVSKETGFYVDIVDADNSAKTLTLNVSGSNWVTAGWPYEINGTVYYRDAAKAAAAGADKYRADDRTLTIPYEGDAGDAFDITVRNTDAATVSRHTYTVPLAVTSDKTLTGDQTQDIYVKGATLTVNAGLTAKKIYVGADAKLVINSGITLTVDTLYLRTVPAGSAELTNKGTVTAQKVYYTRIIKDKSGYFQFGLPLTSTQKPLAVRLTDGTDPKYATGSGWILRYYDEASRAENGVGDNWRTLAADAAVTGGKGYEMYSGQNYYREFCFPVNLNELNRSVSVNYTNGSQAANNGWNVLVSPLTDTYTNDPVPEGMTISWMQQDGTFEQEPLTEVAPAKTFAFQASKTGTVSFEGSQVVAAAPRRVAAAEEPERIQWIHLDIKDGNGIGDQTSIYSHPTRYEQTYKTGIDVAKQSLTASRALIYSSHAYGEMAFAGVADSLLESGVALTVYSPAAQELMLSLRENEWLNRLENVWLMDTETGMRVNLIESDYAFRVPEGTTKGRLFIEASFRAPQVATDIDNVQSDKAQGTKARKVIINGKMYIIVNDRMYDTTGKQVNK